MHRIVGFALFVLACSHVAQAQVTTYSNRGAWGAAAGALVQTEDMNSFATDTSFQGIVITLLNQAITQLNGPPGNSPVNFIDVSPFEEDGKRSIDNTPYVLGEVDDTGTTIRIEFASPVSGWGADFVSHDGATVIDVFDPFNNLIGTTASVADETTFYGFHLDSGQTAGRIELKFVGLFNDLFGMDNLSFVASGTPDPAASISSLVAAVGAIATLNAGHTTSLVQKLNAVQALISDRPVPMSSSQARAAARILNAFILEVQTLVNSGAISASVGQALIADAAVLAALLE